MLKAQTVERRLDEMKLPKAAQKVRAAARVRHIAGTKWGSQRYLNMKRLEDMRRNELTQLAV